MSGSSVRSFRSTSTGPSRPPLRQSGFAPPSRQAYATENEAVEEVEEGDDGDPAGVPEEGDFSLEEILQTEADNSALELEEAVNEGVDAHVIEDLEESVESAAEALLTMKEARSKLNNIRRDRGYGRASTSGQPAQKRGSAGSQSKKTAKNPCFDCGEGGHWAGDPQCPSPGAGLARAKKASSTSPPKVVKQVKIAEALQLEADDPGSHVENIHEIHMATRVNLKEALEFHHQHVPVEVNAASASPLSWDKRLVGALDTACNRTCTGTTWLSTYLQCLQGAPEHIRKLAFSVPEHEVFRFGNGGTQVSEERWRLPVLLGDCLACIWVSVVPVQSLGLLLGRDFLEAVGSTLNFAKKTIRFSYLSSQVLPLRQLMAGHFMLHLQPENGVWRSPGPGKWRKLGVDGVVELQLSAHAWLNLKLSMQQCNHGDTHEHLLTEGSIKIGNMVCDMSVQAMSGVSSTANSPTTSSSTRSTRRSTPSRVGKHGKPGRPQVRSPMASNGASASRSKSLASSRHPMLVLTALISALRAFSIPSDCIGRPMAIPGRVDVQKWHPSEEALSAVAAVEGLHREQCERASLHPQQVGVEYGFSRGPRPERLVGSPRASRPSELSEEGRPARSPRAGQGGRRKGSSGRGCSNPARPSWRNAHSTPRSFATCSSVEGRDQRQGNQRRDQDRLPPNGAGLDGQTQVAAVAGNFGGINGLQNTRAAKSQSFSQSKPDRSFRCSFRSQRNDHTGSAQANVRFARREVPRNAGASEPVHHEVQSADGKFAGRVDEPGGWRSSDGGWNPWSINTKVKPGLGLMITQAWKQHCRDRHHVSASAKEVLEVMNQQFEGEMCGFLEDPFVHFIDLTVNEKNPLVTEVFTTSQRVTKTAARKGHKVGEAMSLDTGWDFRRERDRQLAYELVERTKPEFLVIAFPCGPFSPLQFLRRSTTYEARLAEGRILMDFGLSLCRLQRANGRHYVLENPKPSRAWNEKSMQKFLDEQVDVRFAEFDQCRFGLKSFGGTGLHRKSTRVASSSPEVVSQLHDRVCKRNHDHVPVLGGSKITSHAGLYPPQLASAIVRGMERQFERDHSAVREVQALESGGGSDDGAAEDHDGLFTYGPGSDESGDESETDIKKHKIPSSLKQTIKRLHENTGHRSNRRLARALAVAGAPPEAILAAKRHQCSVCDEKRQPKSRRPASLPTPRDVGDQLHIDLLEVTDLNEGKFIVAHVTDHATRFQMADIIPSKSSSHVVRFFKTKWLPMFGPPRVIVADQGREFISWEFEECCSEMGTLLWHCPVQAPWMNGVAERSGGILKTLIRSIVMTHSVLGADEMELAVAEAVSAYNSDIGEAGVSPIQATIGRQPRQFADSLTSHGQLAELGLAEDKPSLARQLAMRETAKVAMLRLHFSRGLRRAELARSRSHTHEKVPEPGDLVYYWRASKWNGKTQPSRRKLSLRRWHGPALVVAIEGHSSAYVSHKGQLTKCALEHIRPASALEQVSAGVWRDAIDEVIEESVRYLTERGQGGQVGNNGLSPDGLAPESGPGQRQPLDLGSSQALDFGQDQSMDFVQPLGLSARLDLPPVTPQEVISSLQPADAREDRAPSSLPSSRRVSSVVSGAAPGTPVGDLLTRSGSLRMQPVLSRAVELDEQHRGSKRMAEVPISSLQQSEQGDPEAPVSVGQPSVPAHEALEVTKHPLRELVDELEHFYDLDEAFPADHGSWDGRWGLPSQTEWCARQRLGFTWPSGAQEVNAVQTARKEFHWSKMSDSERREFQEAAKRGWSVWTENDAVEVLSDQEADQVRARLARNGENAKLLTPRWVFTDKNDGVRTPELDLPLKANARLVVPGYKDTLSYTLRKDAPTASRISQHLLFVLTASYYLLFDWRLVSADIKSAFLKGDPYMSGVRELFLTNIKSLTGEPLLPFSKSGLARIKKGVFGLADAPRQWYLRLHRALSERGWERSPFDAACWLLWSADRSRLHGIILSHVDDLLLGGDPVAQRHLEDLGKELGFGSVERDSFQYCGKRICQDKSGIITVSMLEYHQNVQPVRIPVERRKRPDSALTPSELKQLRAILGSLQWLVAQVRFDMGYHLSVLQGETPTINTLMKANSLVKRFKETPDFSLKFKPMSLDGCGFVVVADASLGNVLRAGGADGKPIEKVFSQAAYFVLLADKDLLQGREGSFAVVDARSHRLPRVCRSTYAAELLNVEESFDVGQLIRGFWGVLRGLPVLQDRLSVNEIPLTVVTDAKDVYDKNTSDTTSYGSQKSLAFTIAWLRAQLRLPRTQLRWTSTENMFVDAGTKDMDLQHIHKILNSCRWNMCYEPKFIKQGGKKVRAGKASSREVKVGMPMSSSDPLFGFLLKLGELSGWHIKDGVPIQVARNARSYRLPMPRFDPLAYPSRSTFRRFDHADGRSEWRRLEDHVQYGDLPLRQGLIGDQAAVLVTFFHAATVNKERESAEKSNH